MKVNRTFVIVDRDEMSKNTEWADAHDAICSAINKVSWPPDESSGLFKLTRIITLKEGKTYVDLKEKEATWNKPLKHFRNGVVPLRRAFRSRMEETLDWKSEEPLSLTQYFEESRKATGTAKICLYPSGEAVTEAMHEGLGEFDFWFKSESGLRVVVEWETGNVSSSHRSLNKMCLALIGGLVDAAVLIVPSRDLATHLTDRIGNIKELQPYFYFWQHSGTQIKRGLLAVIEVEHDMIVNSTDLRDLIPSGQDGNADKKPIKRSVKKRDKDKASTKKKAKKRDA